MATMKRATVVAAALAALAVPLTAWAEARDGSLTPIYTVPGHVDGSVPDAPLVRVGAKLFGTTQDGGAGHCGTVFSVDPRTGRYTVVYSFTCMGDGSRPVAGLAVMGGKLFGTTTEGNPSTHGTVFEIDPVTGLETTVAGLSGPVKLVISPLLGFHGRLYGTAALGGGNTDSGCVFSVDAASGTVTTLYSFKGAPDDAYPNGALIQHGGKLYGTTSKGGKYSAGTIYRVDPGTGGVTTQYSFAGGNDGRVPLAPLLELGGVLYGTTERGGVQDAGTVFSFDPAGGTEHVLYSFTGGKDGDAPVAGLGSANGLLYGLTTEGGPFNRGLVFSVDPASGVKTTLHLFTAAEGDSADGGLVLDGPLFYGTLPSGGPFFEHPDGTVFSFDPATTRVATLHVFTGSDFTSISAMITVGGSLYGTTGSAGAFGHGSIFKVDRATGAGNTVYSFTGMDDGGEPVASLAEVGGVLYGTTTDSGRGGAGTVFGYDPATHSLTTLHGFSGGADGATPNAELLALNGLLYGTTESGGTSNGGTVFKVDPASGSETVLYSFQLHSDGYHPQYGLTVANGLLYGTTAYSSSANCGTLYSVDPATGKETLLHVFQGIGDGCQPSATLLSANGVLYGATQGLHGRGNKATAFMFDPAAGKETVLHSFNLGKGPTAPFIAVDDKLYGTTLNSGDADLGSLISLDPATGHVDTLYSFTGGIDGYHPPSALLYEDGVFYGTNYVDGMFGGLVYGFTK